MGKHMICPLAELPEGSRKIVRLEGRSIGIFHIKQELYALRNVCPHQGAELCQGKIQGMMLPSVPGKYVYGRDGEILRCPWHGWEFDITTGKSVFDPFKYRVKSYEVEVVQQQPEEEEKKVETYPVHVEAGYIVVTV